MMERYFPIFEKTGYSQYVQSIVHRVALYAGLSPFINICLKY